MAGYNVPTNFHEFKFTDFRNAAVDHFMHTGRLRAIELMYTAQMNALDNWDDWHVTDEHHNLWVRVKAYIVNSR